MPKLKIWTAQYNYSGGDRIDITVKSAVYPWNIFAPTWDMVMKYKRAGGSKEAQRIYVKDYSAIIDKAFEVCSQGLADLIKADMTITLVCFCRPGDFCHRVLLAKHFETLGAVYYGER